MNILLLAIAPSVFSNVYILFKFLLMLSTQHFSAQYHGPNQA
jgi:hypothetical protein